MVKKGKLYGVGVGPGAPDLLTLRAVHVLNNVDVILTAASPRNDYSHALETARPYIAPHAAIVRLEFPMTRNTATLEQAWTVAATRTKEVLYAGKNAAFLTIGDPLIYSTFGYLMQTLAQCDAELDIEIISGITSFQAAAARTHTVLCEGQEDLLIVPGINEEEALCKSLHHVDNAVILKAYKNFPAIRCALQKTERIKKARFASYICHENEHICTDITELSDTPPYLSLVISKK